MFPGYDAYRTYVAVQRHFESSYEYFKYNGAIKVSETSYQARKDRYFFERAGKIFKDQSEFLQFVVYAYSSGNAGWIGDLLKLFAKTGYTDWKRRIDSLSYTFLGQLNILHDTGVSFKRLFAFNEGEHPILYTMYLKEEIYPETMVVLNVLGNYFPKWKVVGDIIINDSLLMLEKYQPFLLDFVDVNTETYKKIVYDVYLNK